MANVERSIVPSENGPIYQVKFPDMKESYLFQTIFWSDITFKFNEEDPSKSYFIKESVRDAIPIQNCEFREMKDMSGNPILLLGSERVTDMPMIFVGMLSLPVDEECRLAITEAAKAPENVKMNC